MTCYIVGYFDGAKLEHFSVKTKYFTDKCSAK
nr:MAG TPA: hypothetical protein [Caudoviricetes sp.]